MAASAVTTSNCKDGATSILSPEDREIMLQPKAQAVSFMGYQPHLIVYAVKMLNKKENVLEVGRILLEVEKLAEQEKREGGLPPLDGNIDRNRCGTDGESKKDDSLKCVDAQKLQKFAAADVDDLQTDSVPLEANEMTIDRAPELAVEEDSRDKKDGMALRLKLKALRTENEKLKERHLCKKCRSQPVSITFLPCGHYSYCYDCGQTLKACPICRKTILADVRTFLA